MDHVVGTDVLPAAHHAHDFDAIGYGNVEDEVAADREAAQSSLQVRTLPSSERILHEHLEYLTDPLDEIVSRANVVDGDIAPDRIKVDVSLRPLAKPIWHA